MELLYSTSRSSIGNRSIFQTDYISHKLHLSLRQFYTHTHGHTHGHTHARQYFLMRLKPFQEEQKKAGRRRRRNSYKMESLCSPLITDTLETEQKSDQIKSNQIKHEYRTAMRLKCDRQQRDRILIPDQISSVCYAGCKGTAERKTIMRKIKK